MTEYECLTIIVTNDKVATLLKFIDACDELLTVDNGGGVILSKNNRPQLYIHENDKRICCLFGVGSYLTIASTEERLIKEALVMRKLITNPLLHMDLDIIGEGTLQLYKKTKNIL